MPFAEEDGGIGGGAIELMIVMEQLGPGPSGGACLATIVPPAAPQYAGNEAQKGAYSAL